VRTRLEPDPVAVKWINPKIPRGEDRDIVVSVGEAGGIWALDRATGQFLWAKPFPLDVPQFHISHTRRRYRAHSHQLEFGDEAGQGPHVRIISARLAESQEQRRYHEENS
jgi:hypothetical protein